MKNILRSLFAGTIAGLMMVGAVFALTVPATFSPRSFPSQQTHYWRISMSLPFCTQVAASCTVKVGALPYNAMVLRVTAVTSTAFNSTTSDVVTLGTTQANANEIVSAGMSIHTQAIVAGTVLATASSATGNGATQTGSDGGFDLWLKWTAGAGNTATTGNAAIVVEYVGPNDWGCTAVPMGSTAPGC